MLEFNEASVGYGKKKVIDSVSFTAEQSKITVIIGKNGSGKSTLLRAASGNLKYGGSIKLNGREVSAISAKDRAKLEAVMPQLLRNPSVSVRELISYGRQPYTGFSGILSASDKAKVEEVIAATGLAELAESYANQISGGELQRAYFAMLIAQDSPNILLDEPGAHLDAAYDRRMSEFLISARSSGKTVLAVFHNINRAIEIADKLVVINNGSCAYTGSCDDFIKSNIAETLFGLKKYICQSGEGTEKILFM